LSDPLDLILLLALPALLVCSAFFSGSETALFSLSSPQRVSLERSPVIGGAVHALLSDTRKLLITLLLGNMSINVLYFVLSSILQVRNRTALGPIADVALPAGTLIGIILVGEIAPKVLAARMPARWTGAACLPLLALHRLIGPLRYGIERAVITPLARLIAPRQRPPALSPEELESLLRLSEERGVIDAEEEQQLQQVLSLSQLRVKDLMTPRVDIAAFDLDRPPKELLELARGAVQSRIPAYRHGLDDVKGIVLARQVLLDPPTHGSEVQALLRQVRFVPELQRADRLLADFRKSRTTFAMVVDEYGGTAGLITLEDVVERMVGDIRGPQEPAPAPRLQCLGPGAWRVSGDLPVRDWGEAAEDLAPPQGVSTMGGLVMAKLGRLPEEGEELEMGPVRIAVEAMVGRRVQWLRVDLRV
jgi:CBS domain containing-hemolysin-like protein